MLVSYVQIFSIKSVYIIRCCGHVDAHLHLRAAEAASIEANTALEYLLSTLIEILPQKSREV